MSKVDPKEVREERALNGVEAWTIVKGVPLCLVDAPPAGVPFLVTSEGVKFAVAVVGEDRAVNLLALACPHGSHGSHPKVRDRFAELRRKVAERGLGDFIRFNESAAADCPLCGGAEWFPVDSGQARGVVILASSFGVFRGVRIPTEGEGHDALTSVDGLVMIRSLLAGAAPATGNAREALDASALPVPPREAEASFFCSSRNNDKGQG